MSNTQDESPKGSTENAAPPGHQVGSVGRICRALSERTVTALIFLCGVSAIIFVFSIFYFVFREGYPFIRDSLDLKGFFLSEEWYPTSETNKRYGILALLAGSASVTLVATLVAGPFGLGCAIFISQFCDGKFRETLKILVELLAAIPSVVWGFIGLAVMNPLIIRFAEVPIGLCVLNAGVIVGLMCVPITVSIAEDAIRAVPDTYLEAAEAMGATRWQTIHRVILPAAKSGLLAAVLLGVARAVGETMAVLMCTGHTINIPFDGRLPFLHVFESVRTLTATIAAELGEVPRLDPLPDGNYPVEARHWQVLFVLGIVLFAITFLINLIADLIVKGIRKKA